MTLYWKQNWDPDNVVEWLKKVFCEINRDEKNNIWEISLLKGFAEFSEGQGLDSLSYCWQE